jgi:hypothetical protein
MSNRPLCRRSHHFRVPQRPALGPDDPGQDFKYKYKIVDFFNYNYKYVTYIRNIANLPMI